MAVAADSVWPQLSDYHRARFALEALSFLKATRAIGSPQYHWMRATLIAGLAPHIQHMLRGDDSAEAAVIRGED